VSFVRRRGLDTLNGIEDLQLGIEGEVWGGPTIPGLSKDDEFALGIGVSGAVEPTLTSAVGAHVAVEGRRASNVPAGSDAWRDMFAEVDAWGYLQPSKNPDHTLVAAFSGVGGRNGSLPFQLTLGGDTGLRGYPRHVYPGGARLVGSVEYRSFWGWPFPQLFDLGSVAFVDAGKIWPGDVSFGTESPIRMTVGVGVRAAFPPGSRQTFRADVGLPIGPGVTSRGVVVSFGVGQAIGRRISRRDPQLVRSARFRLTSSSFLYGQP
jgi:hypothetical protein